MTTVFTFWFVIVLAVVLGLGGLVTGVMRMRFGQEFRGVDFVWIVALLFALIFGASAGSLSDDPGIYTRVVCAPMPMTILHLTFMNGFFGNTDRIRVDTDHGVYILASDSLIPESGSIYLVQRAKRWNSDQRDFLCLQSTNHCWATIRPTQ